MKNIMKYHKERLDRKDSNAVLKGVSSNESRVQQPNDKKNSQNNPEFGDQPTAIDSTDHQMRRIHNGSDIFFVKDQPEVAIREASKSRGRRPTSTNNIFPTREEESNPSHIRKMSPLKYKYDLTSHIEGLSRSLAKEDRPGAPQNDLSEPSKGKKHYRDGPADTQSAFFREYFQKKAEPIPSIPERAPRVTVPAQATRGNLIDEYRRKIAQLE
jgi:hypothetical protein